MNLDRESDAVSTLLLVMLNIAWCVAALLWFRKIVAMRFGLALAFILDGPGAIGWPFSVVVLGARIFGFARGMWVPNNPWECGSMWMGIAFGLLVLLNGSAMLMVALWGLEEDQRRGDRHKEHYVNFQPGFLSVPLSVGLAVWGVVIVVRSLIA